MSMSNYQFALGVAKAMKNTILAILSPESLLTVSFFRCLCQISLVLNYFLWPKKFDISSVDCYIISHLQISFSGCGVLLL